MNQSIKELEWDSIETRLFGSAVLIASALAIEPWLTLPMKWATWCYFLLCAGIVLRKRSRGAHALLMGSGVAGDLALVLILQFQRNAIQTAMAFTLTPLQQAHIGFSTGATVLYLPLVYLGWRQWRGQSGGASPGKAQLHRRLGMAAFFLRTAGFILMFSLLGHNSGH